MNTIQDDIDSLLKEASEKTVEADRIKRLFSKFPDLRKHVGRWKKIAFCSKSVNSRVNKYDMRHNCGCCRNSPLEIWPYLDTEDGRIYSDPPIFIVGEKDRTYGDRPNSGWKSGLVESGIPDVIIDGVSEHFRIDKQNRIDMVSGDEEGHDE